MTKNVNEPQVTDGNENRFAVIFIDNVTKVQIAAATEDMDKFTKTDLMKMVKAFKEGVKKEEAFDFNRKKEAEKELNKDESNKRGNSKISQRLRRTRKVRKP